MRQVTVIDDTVLLFGTSAPTDNTSVYSISAGVEVGYCVDQKDPAGTFVPFPDPQPNGNFRHGLGCFLCVQVTGSVLVLF